MKRSLLTMLGIVVATISVLASDGSNKLTVVVKNIESTDGVLSVTLFNSEESWLNDGTVQKVTIGNQDAMEVIFDNLPNGSYGVSVVHDANGNGKMDTGTFGIPTEDYGFSNDARGSFGPANFADSRFELSEDKQIIINIK